MSGLIDNALGAFAKLQETEEGREILKEKLIKPLAELMESEPLVYKKLKEDRATEAGLKDAILASCDRITTVFIVHHNEAIDHFAGYGRFTQFVLKLLKVEQWTMPYVEIIVGIKDEQPEDAHRISECVYYKMPCGIPYDIRLMED